MIEMFIFNNVLEFCFSVTFLASGFDYSVGLVSLVYFAGLEVVQPIKKWGYLKASGYKLLLYFIYSKVLVI